MDLLERGFSAIQINSQIKDSNRLIPLQLHPIFPTCRHARMKHPSLICLCKTAVSRTSTPFVTTHWFDKRSVFQYMMCTQYWIPREEQRLAYNSPAFNNSAEMEYLFLKTMGVSWFCLRGNERSVTFTAKKENATGLIITMGQPPFSLWGICIISPKARLCIGIATALQTGEFLVLQIFVNEMFISQIGSKCA